MTGRDDAGDKTQNFDSAIKAGCLKHFADQTLELGEYLRSTSPDFDRSSTVRAGARGISH
jgi:hypothetical protein